MIKKLSIFLIAVLTVASLGAQPAERSGSAVYAPRAGQVQVSAVLGSSLYFEFLDNLTPLLPGYLPGDELGIDPIYGNSVGYYLQMGSLNNNSVARAHNCHYEIWELPSGGGDDDVSRCHSG